MASKNLLLEDITISPKLLTTVYPKTVIQRITQWFKEKATPLGEHCWVELIPFQYKGRTIRLYSRYLRPILLQWKKSISSLSFTKYVETRILPKRSPEEIESHIMVYMDPNELNSCKVNFQGERAYRGGSLVEDGRYMFVLDPEGQSLYIRTKKRGNYNHSSFFAGGPVQSAGMATLKEGKIVAITYASGHYRPSEKEEANLRLFLENALGKDRAEKITHSHRVRGPNFEKPLGGGKKCLRL